MPGLFITMVVMLFVVVLALNFTTGEKKLDQSVERLYAADDPAFARAMGVLLGPAILPGNRFEVLLNGDRIFPAMLASIRAAKKTITFESYIYWSDAIGKEFADALAERARAGVKVHVLLDWVGSNKMDPAHVEAMAAAGNDAAQMFSSSPSGGSESMHLMYLLAITSAQHSIHLSSAYFVPDKLSTQALAAALERGVKVQIIVPGKHTDAAIVRNASRARWGDLLAAGAEIHEYQPTMYHCKVLIIDSLMVSVGSTNFDTRSFRLNDEANLNIYAAEFARQHVDVFNADLLRSRRISLQAWQQRPLSEKLLEHAASLIGSQL